MRSCGLQFEGYVTVKIIKFKLGCICNCRVYFRGDEGVLFPSWS